MSKFFKLFLLLQIVLSANLFSMFSDQTCITFCNNVRNERLNRVCVALDGCCSDEERSYLVNWKNKPTSLGLNKDNTSLVYAAMNNDKKIVEKLVRYANQTSKNKALSFAVQYDCDDVIELLLKSGAKAEGDESCDQSPILRSAFKGNCKIFEKLIRSLFATKNVDELISILNKKDVYSGRALLHIIVRKHPDSEKKSNKFQFKTFYAFNEFFDCFICKCGCYLNFEQLDNDGYSVIHWLAKFYDIKAIDLIFNHIRDCCCCLGNRHKYVRDLLNLKSENDAKYTPFDAAKNIKIERKVTNVFVPGKGYVPEYSNEQLVDKKRKEETEKFLNKWLDWAKRRNSSDGRGYYTGSARKRARRS